MTPPLRIAPDGARALAALLRGKPSAPMTPAMNALIEAEVVDDSVAALAAVYARRRQHAPHAMIDGRAPAARFLRRLHRRWRVTQSASFTDRFSPAALERAGRRAQRLAIAWPGATALTVGVWYAFWAIDDPRSRRDLLASLPAADARRVAQAPLDPSDAARFWR